MSLTEKNDVNWSGFIRLCLALKSDAQFEELFSIFLTRAEKEDIARRFAIVCELLKGEKTQREIAKQFKISIAKITRGSNALKIADAKMLSLLARLAKD
jgi:TrpR family transcriptional regulator, trp operon repressor